MTLKELKEELNGHHDAKWDEHYDLVNDGELAKGLEILGEANGIHYVQEFIDAILENRVNEDGSFSFKKDLED